MIIQTKAHARAGLVGNPSDGYYGKTISFIIRNFAACVTLYETPELEILLSEQDHSGFPSLESLVEDVRLNGYYGGIRLIKATIKRFWQFCREKELCLEEKNFSIRYHSDIPRGVGLAGSSAIITAALRALMQFYGVGEEKLPKPWQASLVLAVETEELGISAGLQDRVIQVYEGLVYMDFSRSVMEGQGHGNYEPLDPEVLPELFIAYSTDLGQGSGVFHSSIRQRFQAGDPEVTRAMEQFADFAAEGRGHLLKGGKGKTGRDHGPEL